MRKLRRPRPVAHPSPRPERFCENAGEIRSLNAQAFGELRQSITSSGEDFVQRMRTMEADRLQASVSSISSSTSVDSPMQLDNEEALAENGDEEEVDIVCSAASSSDSSVHFPVIPAHICSSLTRSTSGTADAEDADMLLSTPAHIVTLPTRRNSLSSVYNIPEPPSQSRPKRRDSEDRTIDALSLAMATGAASIRDYSAVRAALGAEHPAEAAAAIGGMWN